MPSVSQVRPGNGSILWRLSAGQPVSHNGVTCGTAASMSRRRHTVGETRTGPNRCPAVVDRDVLGPVGARDRAEPERHDDSHIAGLSRIPLQTIAQDATTLAGSALGLAPGAYRGRTGRGVRGGGCSSARR